MGRDIKFRAWNDRTSKMMDADWLESDPIISAGLSYGKLFIAETYHGDWRELPIMQFTGLHDKNGKAIYEGDILTAKDYPFYGDEACEKELNYVGEVFWDDDGLRWYYEMHVVSNRVRGAACGDVLCNQKHDGKNTSDWEVIGNIYENPELLTVPISPTSE